MQNLDIDKEYSELEERIEKIEIEIIDLQTQLKIKRDEKSRLEDRYEQLGNIQDIEGDVLDKLNKLDKEEKDSVLAAIEKLKSMAIKGLEIESTPKKNISNRKVDNGDEGNQGRRRSRVYVLPSNEYICYKQYKHNNEFNCAYIGFLGNDAEDRRSKWKEILVKNYKELEGRHQKGNSSSYLSNCLSDTARNLSILNKGFSDKNGLQLELHGISFEQLEEIGQYDFTKLPPNNDTKEVLETLVEPSEDVLDKSKEIESNLEPIDKVEDKIEPHAATIKDFSGGNIAYLLSVPDEVSVDRVGSIVKVVNVVKSRKLVEIEIKGEFGTFKVKPETLSLPFELVDVDNESELETEEISV